MKNRFLIISSLLSLGSLSYGQGILSNSGATVDEDKIWIIDSEGNADDPTSIHFGVGTNAPSIAHSLNTNGPLLFESLVEGDETYQRVLITDANGDVKWINKSDLIGGDYDWYEQGTSTAPTSIDDNIYTNGNVQVNNGNLFVKGLSTNSVSITSGTNTSYFLWDSRQRALRMGQDDNGNWNTRSLYSFAFGKNANATTANAIAFGSESLANGVNSYAIGNGAKANKTNSFALGTNANAGGISSYSLGATSISSGNGSIALGNFTSATWNFSIAIGQNSTSSGQKSIALGFDSKASAESSIAIGHDANTNHVHAVALGISSTAGFRSTAVGARTNALGANCIAIGSDGTLTGGNNSIAIGTNTTSDANEAITIGNQITNTTNQSLMVGFNGIPYFFIKGKKRGGTDPLNQNDPNARVGINTTTPDNNLEVVRNAFNSTGISGLRLTNLNSTINTSSQTNNRNVYLSVNDYGDVILVDGTPIPIARNTNIDNNEVAALEARIAKLEAIIEKFDMNEEQAITNTINDFSSATLLQNNPNPFSEKTTISYELEENGFVTLDIFDNKGKLIETLVREQKEGGKYYSEWTPTNLPTGTYNYVLKVNGNTIAKKALYLRK